eukprot:3073842-Ditylum_brightwellii.AAC.1
MQRSFAPNLPSKLNFRKKPTCMNFKLALQPMVLLKLKTNIEEQNKDRIWLRIPPFYLEWFFVCYPDHPLKGVSAEQLYLQNIYISQGTKDAGRK